MNLYSGQFSTLKSIILFKNFISLNRYLLVLSQFCSMLNRTAAAFKQTTTKGGGLTKDFKMLSWFLSIKRTAA